MGRTLPVGMIEVNGPDRAEWRGLRSNPGLRPGLTEATLQVESRHTGNLSLKGSFRQPKAKPWVTVHIHDSSLKGSFNFTSWLLWLSMVGCAQEAPPPARPPATLSPTARESVQKTTAQPQIALSGSELPHFVDTTEESGIDFKRYDDMRGLHRILEANGGGVALFDYDGDGLLDIFFTNGCRLPLKSADRSHFNRLFRNRGRGKFELVVGAGMDQHGQFHGCAVGDFDNDGFDDLYITAFGPNVFCRNNGDGTFADVTAATGTQVPAWSSSAAFSDLNRDGSLELYVVNYVDTGDDPPVLCPNKKSPDGYMQCTPTMFSASDGVLFAADGSGGFQDVTRAAGITGVDGRGLGIAVFDMNHDGWPDIFVANDGTPNFLYINKSETGANAISGSPFVFQDRAAELGAALNIEGRAQASMGVAAGDYDSDGWTDLVVTTFFAEPCTVFRNVKGTGFVDDANASGLGPATRPTLGFGTEFLDYDNDGRLDLFIANGHVDDFTWQSKRELYRMPPQLFHNQGKGRFIEVSSRAGPYFDGRWLGRGVAKGDFDNDGDVDLVVSHQRDRSAVLRNDSPTPSKSVTVKLIGRAPSNRSAFGARVEAEGLGMIHVQEVIGGGSFQSASDRSIHIGLGARQSIPLLRVRWPSGTIDEWRDVAPGRYIGIEQEGLHSTPIDDRH